jgi:hypothetical protein
MKRKTLKKVLFVTQEPCHRILYEKGLRHHFQVVFSPSTEGAAGDVDAVVLDISRRHRETDLDWLRATEKPVVVLTPEDELPLPKAMTRCLLTYPVGMDRILEALAKLGVRAGEP